MSNCLKFHEIRLYVQSGLARVRAYESEDDSSCACDVTCVTTWGRCL